MNTDRNEARRIRKKIVDLGGKPVEAPVGAQAPPPPAAAQFLPRDDREKRYPNDIARLILETRRFLKDRSGILYEYNGTHWERIPDSKLSSYALELDSHQYTTRKRRSEAANYILDSVLMPDVPWRQLAPTEVPCANGVLDVLSCEVRPHRPEDYLETVLPVPYDPAARCPTWLACLDRWFRGDEDADAKIAAIREFFGYILLPHALYKRALFLHGESDTGKSQVALVMAELVGQKNRCTLSTEDMADSRKRAPIVGKMLNVLTELPAESLIADGGFKQLVSTGDPIQIDPKWAQPFDYVPFCKHVIATNSLPGVTDLSRATFNRLLLVQFNNVLPASEQDRDLLVKLRRELPGIFAWAIEGAAELSRNNGRFTEIDSAVASIAEYRAEQNPINDFLVEMMVAREDGEVLLSEVRERFNKWRGNTRYTNQRIGQMLASAGHKCTERVWDSELGAPVRKLKGFRFKTYQGEF